MSESFGIYFHLESSYNLTFFVFFFSLPDLLSEVKLTVGEISRDLTELVHTFRSVTIRLPARVKLFLAREKSSLTCDNRCSAFNVPPKTSS